MGLHRGYTTITAICPLTLGKQHKTLTDEEHEKTGPPNNHSYDTRGGHGLSS